MQAIWIENGELSCRSVSSPVMGEGEARLAVQLAGICGTDLELLNGYYGFAGIPGHEFVARVIDGPDTWIGKRVVLDINIGCGKCEYCLKGLHKHCRSREVVGIKNRQGAFAEEIVVPVDNMLTVPDSVSDALAVFIEPLAAALEILEQIDLKSDTRTLIVGAGRLASVVCAVLIHEVDDLTVCMRTPSRMTALNESAHLLSPDEIETEFDCVIDCTGTAAGFEVALNATKPAGHLVVKSSYIEKLAIDMSRIVIDEICLHGSRCGPMAKAIELLASQKTILPELVIRQYRLEDYRQAFQDAMKPEISKVLFKP